MVVNLKNLFNTTIKRTNFNITFPDFSAKNPFLQLAHFCLFFKSNHENIH